jgi:VanZ family protein
LISTILVEHPWMSPTALGLLVVLGPLLGRWAVDRPRTARWLTAAALVPVGLLTLVPVDRRLSVRCETAWAIPTVGRVELAANVVLFVAPVLFASVASRRPLLVAAAASGLSAAIEATQALLPALGRSCSTDDWLSNTIGAAIGGLLGWLTLRSAFGRPEIGSHGRDRVDSVRSPRHDARR